MNANFVQVVPNSHSWNDFEMLLRYLEYHAGEKIEVDYLITGLKNSIQQSQSNAGDDVEKELGQFIYETNEKNTKVIGTIKVPDNAGEQDEIIYDIAKMSMDGLLPKSERLKRIKQKYSISKI